MAMLEVHATPPLHDPVLLCAFTGWADAAFAASGAVRYLTGRYPGQLIAEFDPDEVYSYTITRPLSAIVAPGRRAMRWPQLRWVALRVPSQPHDFVVFTGPEPDLKWKACVDVLTQFARRLDIRQAIALGAFYAAVPHHGVPFLIGYSSDPTWQARLAALGVHESPYEGPTGFLSAAVAGLQAAGVGTAACWAAAPNYMSGANNPKLAAALLGIAEGLLEQPIPRDELVSAGAEMEAQIDQALRNRPDLQEFVQRLGGGAGEPNPPQAQAQAEAPQGSPPGPEELPSAEEILNDLEEHLRRMRKQPPEDQ